MRQIHGLGLVCLLALACGDDGDDGGDGSTGAATMTTSSTTTASTSGTTDPTGSTSTTGTTDGTSTSSTTTDPTTSTTDAGSTGGGSTGGGSESGGATTGGETAIAAAEIMPRSGSMAMGKASFFQVGDQIRVEIVVSQTRPEGLHGVHIHETGDCSAKDGTSAGGHWNPAGVDHGPFEGGHLGDLGNIDVDDMGNGTLMLTTTMSQWAVGSGDDSELVGRAIILHEREDDLSASPDPGPRIGCGEILDMK